MCINLTVCLTMVRDSLRDSDSQVCIEIIEVGLANSGSHAWVGTRACFMGVGSVRAQSIPAIHGPYRPCH